MSIARHPAGKSSKSVSRAVGCCKRDEFPTVSTVRHARPMQSRFVGERIHVHPYPLSASWGRIDGFWGSQGALSVRGLCGEWGGSGSDIKVARRSPANRRLQSVSHCFNTFHEPYSQLLHHRPY
jgi:hypothetical protein